MIHFNDLGRWRPEGLLKAADRLEDGYTIPHFGHLHDVAAVVDALRHAARQVEAAQARALHTASLIDAQGWGFRVADGNIIVREAATTVLTYDADLERVEDLMSDYAGAMADALTDVGVALDEVYAVIDASRRDPNVRAHARARRPLRPRSANRACRDRRRDPWPWCWDR